MTEGQRPHRGVFLLVLGIAGLVTCPLIGIASWIVGNRDIKAMERGEVDPAGRDLTQAGRMLGMVNAGLAAFYVLLFGGGIALILVKQAER